MPTPNFVPLSLEEFQKVVERFDFSSRRIDAVHMHHTWRPRIVDFRGLASILAMWKYHTETNGWSDIAQHVTIDPEGVIWTGRSWKQPPASSAGHNGTTRLGPFMFEMIGDFDKGREELKGRQLAAVIGVIVAIQKRNGLSPESLHFHNQLGSPKTCPGSGIVYKDILAQVKAASASRGVRAKPAAPGAFGLDETRIFSALQVVGAVSRAVDTGDVGMEVMEGSTSLAATLARDGGMVERAPGARDAALALDAAALTSLRPHVVNLVQGEFVPTGIYQTTRADVDAIFTEHLNDRIAQASAANPLHLMLWAHGGLVSERAGLRATARMLDWWKANGVYPIHFVWETGAWETIQQLISGAGARAPEVAARDIWDYSTDPLIELLTRPLGSRLWAGMKRSAERASAPGGGASYFADKLAVLLRQAGKKVCVHAAGHSAGSIFHAHLVPELIARGVTLKTLHFLAPAVRVDTFLDRLEKSVIDKKAIGRFTMFTMARDFERRDNCAHIYHKSLLYLVSQAFEPERKAPILGLDEFLRADPRCQRLFGLDGKPGAAEVVWSQSVAKSGCYATLATSHGDFDGDPPTLNSLMRHVLDKDDVAPIVEYDARNNDRALDEGEDELPAELAIFLRPIGAASGPADPGGPVTAPARPAPPQPAPPGSGRRMALCIGINAYPAKPLEGCVADANLWVTTLQKLGFPRPQTLFDQAATRQGILGGMRALLAEARAGDIIVMQYSGHGTSLPDLDGDEDDGLDEALCPVDYEQGNFVIDDDLKELFADIPEGVNLTCFFDCCHSGTITRLAALRPGVARGARGQAPRARYLEIGPAIRARYEQTRMAGRAAGGPALTRVARRGGRDMREIVFSACRADQVAYESGQQGDFTRIATELLQAGYGQHTHADFLERVLRGFGTQPRQEPQLDCASELRDAVLLAPIPGGA